MQLTEKNTDTKITITTPAGTGTDVELIVEVDDQQSEPNDDFSYEGVYFSPLYPLSSATNNPHPPPSS